MLVRSLGFRTDLMIRRLAGAELRDAGDHIVVRTPAIPTFFWGNFLLLREPPTDGGSRWLDVFDQEFPSAAHVAIAIDGTDAVTGDISALTTEGLELEHNSVLTARRLVGVQRAADVDCRRLSSDDDWEQAVDLRHALNDDDLPEDVEFVRRRAEEMRQLVNAGHACWLGAFVDGIIRASLGIVSDGAGLARYQNVETHPDFRRRGLASALLHAAADIALTEMAASVLVIVADPDYVAIDLYRSLGFVEAERTVQLQCATRTPPRPGEGAAAARPPET